MNQLTQQHRAQQLLLRRRTLGQMRSLWPMLDWARLDATYPQFAVAVGALVQQNARTSAGLAAAYLSAFRRSAGLPPELVRMALPDMAEVGVSLRVTSVVAAKNSASKGRDGGEAMGAAAALAAAAMVRHVLRAGRQTVTINVPVSVWVLGSGGCEFCRDHEGRRITGDLDSHDGCGCTAEPAF